MADPPHFMRGPMYPAYSELREWKLRIKKAGLNPSTPLPTQIKKPALDQTGDFRKENRKPAQSFLPAKMAPPPPEMRRAASVAAGKKPGVAPRGGSGREQDLVAGRNFMSYQEQGMRNVVEEGKGKKGIFGKKFMGFRRSTAQKSGWLG